MIGAAQFETVCLNPVEQTLALCGLQNIAPKCTHMLRPNYGTNQGKRHYLYMPRLGGWVDPTTLDTSMGAMVGTLNADGTGGSLSYTPEIVSPTMVEGISILYTAANVVVPILSMGFNRALTAGERTALSSLIAPIAAAAGVSAAACSLVTGQEFQQRCLKMKVNTALAGSANDSFILPADGAGTYAYTVDWGNGTREYVTANTAQTKDYDATSTFIVTVYGTYRPYFNDGGDKAKLIGLQIGQRGTDLSNAFYGCGALTTLVGYAGTAAVTNMSSMFYNCAAYNQPLPAAFNTSACTNMYEMFYGCAAYNQVLPAAFDTSAVRNMASMFDSCSAYNQVLPAAFDTSAVTNMASMFYGCAAYNQVLPAAFDTGAVTNMAFMFFGCAAYNQPLPASFNTSAVTDMYYMFYGCSAYNQVLPAAFDTSAVTDMSYMFYGCTLFNQALPAAFDTSAVTDMSAMFSGCTAFKQSLAAFNMAAVATITNMLTNCNINATGTTTNYDDTLIAWAAQDLVNSLTFTATNCKYGGDAVSGGQQARTAIATDDLWTFVDGGHI